MAPTVVIVLTIPIVFAGDEPVFDTEPNCATSELVLGTPFTQFAAVPHELELVEFQVLNVCPRTTPTAAARIARKLKVLPFFKTGPAIFQKGRRGRGFGILDVGC
jgi:hypothetical protein